MTLIRVAVPVLQGTKKFIIDKGRPWTLVEHTILSSLAMKEQSLEDLQASSKLPRRVLVEAAVRLMRVGWVELGDVGGKLSFQATHSGKAAATLAELPSPLTRMTQRRSFVIDQITGAVFRRRQLPYHHSYHIEDLEKRDANIIRIERPGKENVGEASSLLHVLFEEDEQFVAFEGGGERLMERWALIAVRDGNVEGLPSHAPEALKEAISNAAVSISKRDLWGIPRVVEAKVTKPAPKISEISCQFTSSDILFGGAEHLEFFKSLIRRARHRVVIHSTFISEEVFKALFDELIIALDRGALIDILWGQDVASGENSSRAAALRIRSQITGSNVDRLRVHPSSTQSHSKILIADQGQASDFVCCIGSCNWLSSNYNSFELSAKTTNSKILEGVFYALAEMCRSPNGHFSPISSDYMKIASTMRSDRGNKPGGAKLALVSADMHNQIVLRARDEVEADVFICSHRISPASGPLVLSAMVAAASQKGRTVKIFYGRTSGGMSSDDAASLVRDDLGTGVDVRQVFDPRLHAKFLAWDDDSLVVSSQNWLSADPPPDKPLSEIGLFIRSKNISRHVKERVLLSVKN